MATIDKSGILSAGSSRILIYDNNGTNVANSDLNVTGGDTSPVGVVGL